MEELQREMEELQADPPLINANLEAFEEEMQVLTQKAEKVNFYYHRMVKFETL
jgi:prefoldin subunit 5